MQRVLGDALISTGALAVLLLVLMSVDPRVRERVADAVYATHNISEVTGAVAQVRDVSKVLLTAARDHSIEHAPMMVFAAAATVLVLFMLRT